MSLSIMFNRTLQFLKYFSVAFKLRITYNSFTLIKEENIMASRMVVAKNLKNGNYLSAQSVKEMAKKMGTSRTNLSDVINSRDGRMTVSGKTYGLVV
jgi:hypothetical protein